MLQTSNGRRQLPIVRFAVAGVSIVVISAAGAAAMVPTTKSVSLDVLPVAAVDQSSDTIGIADSYLFGQTPAQINTALDQMQSLGVNNVRIMIPWAYVEYAPDTYYWGYVDSVVNAADSRGMGVLAVLNSTPAWAVDPSTTSIYGKPANPADYGQFASAVATRYKGKIGAYEIWNEPNAAMFYAPAPDPATYTDLLKAAYPAIKTADPNAVVVGGVTGAVVDYGNLTMNPVTFVNGIYAAGGKGYFDALSYHPYQYTTPFSQGGSLPNSPINQLTAMRNLMVANGDSNKLIWASEYGEPSSIGGDAQQAAYLQDMLMTWKTLGYAGPAFVWTLQDQNTGSTNPDDTFGLYRSDGTMKPAADVIKALTAQSAANAYAKALADAYAKALADAYAQALADATAKALADANAQALADAQAKALADANARALADAAAQALADANAQAIADATAQALAAAGNQALADTAAQALAAAQAKALADANARALADAAAQALADANAQALANAQAKALADAAAQAIADANAKALADANTKAIADAQAAALADATAKALADAQAKALADANAKALADANAKALAAANAKALADANAKALADATAKAVADLNAQTLVNPAAGMNPPAASSTHGSAGTTTAVVAKNSTTGSGGQQFSTATDVATQIPAVGSNASPTNQVTAAVGRVTAAISQIAQALGGRRTQAVAGAGAGSAKPQTAGEGAGPAA